MRRYDARDLVGLLQDVIVLAPQDAARIEAALRQRFGGSVVHIAERPPVTVADIDAGLRNRKPVALIAKETGVSRATIYRMLRTGKSLKTDPR